MPDTQGLYSLEKDEAGLTRRERQVLDLLRGSEDGRTPVSQLECARQLGISRQRVRQIVEDLLRKGYSVPGVKPPPR